MDRNYELVRRIGLAINKIVGVYYLLARHYGCNENTLAFLYALDDGQPHSQKEISDEWLIPRTTVNSTVKHMLADGYITCTTEPHKKEKAIMLTEKGRAYAAELFRGVYQAEEQAIIDTLEQFSPEFVSALERFSARLHQEFHEIIRKEARCREAGSSGTENNRAETERS